MREEIRGGEDRNFKMKKREKSMKEMRQGGNERKEKTKKEEDRLNVRENTRESEMGDKNVEWRAEKEAMPGR